MRMTSLSMKHVFDKTNVLAMVLLVKKLASLSPGEVVSVLCFYADMTSYASTFRLFRIDTVASVNFDKCISISILKRVSELSLSLAVSCL